MKSFLCILFLSVPVAAQPIPSTAAALAAAPPPQVDAPPLGITGLKASGYVGAGVLMGGFAGWWMDRKTANCPTGQHDCGLGPPGWIIVGSGLGWIAGITTFNAIEDFSGRGGTILGGLLGGAAGVGIGTGLGSIAPDTAMEWITPLSLAFVGMTFGAGYAHIVGGDPDSNREPAKTRSTLAPAPVGQGGMGLHLLGHF